MSLRATCRCFAHSSARFEREHDGDVRVRFPSSRRLLANLRKPGYGGPKRARRDGRFYRGTPISGNRDMKVGHEVERRAGRVELVMIDRFVEERNVGFVQHRTTLLVQIRWPWTRANKDSPNCTNRFLRPPPCAVIDPDNSMISQRANFPPVCADV